MNESTPQPTSVRAAITGFLDSRLADKLKGIKDPAKREKLIDDHRFENWIPTAAKNASGLTLVTHSPKFANSSSSTSGVRFLPTAPLPEGLVGTEGADIPDDVVGNAAFLGAFAFLRVSYRDETLLSRLLRDDSETIGALADDPSQATALAKQFKAIAKTGKQVVTDELAKQIYFPVSEAEENYHLLTILYPTSVAHGFHFTISDDKFSEQTKELRKMPVAEIEAPDSYREYPGLAKTSFGGSKPQNITQLNSKRAGNAYLLPSLPPDWSADLLNLSPAATTVFDRFLAGNPVIRTELRSLAEYLRKYHPKNEEYRDAIKSQVLIVIDAVLDLGDLLGELPPTWSDAYSLIAEEKDWLDPFRDREGEREPCDATFLGKRFGAWLVQSLREIKSPRSGKGVPSQPLSLDADHAKAWSALFTEEFRFHQPRS